MVDGAIVVQCFNKPDTLVRTLQSLLDCRGRERFRLWLWIDHPTGSLRPDEFAAAWSEVGLVCDRFRAQNIGAFRDIELRRNSSNLGAYRTCRAAVDAALVADPFVIFTEDDTVFATDALDWFRSAIGQGLLDARDCWALAGESIFFDAREKAVDAGFVRRAARFADRAGYLSNYVRLPFLPSTCFATNGTSWAEFGSTRGRQIGDEAVNQRCTAEGKHCVFPVVARVKDVGMLHRFGLSVTVHGKDGVKEIKNTYLMSDMLGAREPDKMLQPLPPSEAGALFDRSVNLKGFPVDYLPQKE